MHTDPSRPIARALVAAVFAFGAAAGAHAGPITQVIAFGDSLSDNGNFYARTGSPPEPYWQGRYSNGPVAVEYLAQRLGVGLADYAYGGAQTGMGNVSVPVTSPMWATGLQTQVATYQQLLQSMGVGADPNALYVVWAGANDLSGPMTNPQQTIATAIQNLTQSVVQLYGMGARQFLLPTLPDLGLTAGAWAQGAAYQQQASALSAAFDGALMQAYAQLAQQLVGERFIVFDSLTAHHQALSALAAAGGDVRNQCVNMAAGTVCANPGMTFYWDWVHPTTAVHAQLAAQMADQVIPEPASIAMVALALLALGVSRRRVR